MELRQLGITVLLQCQHLTEIRGKRFLRPMVELRHAVCADLLNRRVQIRLREAVWLCLRHFIAFRTFIVHLIHVFYNPVQNLLFAGIVLIQGGFCES